MGRPAIDLDDYLDWQERLENYKASNLEVEEFCLQEGVSRTTFYKWARCAPGRDRSHDELFRCADLLVHDTHEHELQF